MRAGKKEKRSILSDYSTIELLTFIAHAWRGRMIKKRLIPTSADGPICL
jgi:hypothetical protein